MIAIAQCTMRCKFIQNMNISQNPPVHSCVNFKDKHVVLAAYEPIVGYVTSQLLNKFINHDPLTPWVRLYQRTLVVTWSRYSRFEF